MTGKDKELNEEQLKKAAGGHGDPGDPESRRQSDAGELSDEELGDAHGAGGRARDKEHEEEAD